MAEFPANVRLFSLECSKSVRHYSACSFVGWSVSLLWVGLLTRANWGKAGLRPSRGCARIHSRLRRSVALPIVFSVGLRAARAGRFRFTKKAHAESARIGGDSARARSRYQGVADSLGSDRYRRCDRFKLYWSSSCLGRARLRPSHRFLG